MTRRPTNDLLRAELFIRNDYRENNKKYDCVFVIEPIGDHRVIAMMTEYRVGQSGYCGEKIHLVVAELTHALTLSFLVLFLFVAALSNGSDN